jgi:excisionase family DNA binding protein
MKLPHHLTPREAALRLQTSEKTILEWINEGRLKALNVARSGKRWQIPESALNTIFQQQSAPEGRRAEVIEFF